MLTMATDTETREQLWVEHNLLDERINNLYRREQVMTSEIDVLIERQRLVWNRIIRYEMQKTGKITNYLNGKRED